MGAQSSNISKFFVSRKASSVNTMLNNSAEYVTPHRIDGRVAPTKSGSAVRPGLRSLQFPPPDPEHSANPANNFRCTQAARYPKNRAPTPSPQNPLCPPHAPHHQYENEVHTAKPP